ncbi:serine carboxypeptidase-like 35 [Nymphaea colorata]|nr:serine carboxypeptidase-like 35 [Nymphaea colorata]
MANSVRLFCFLFVVQLVTTFFPEARASEEHGGGYPLSESDLVRGLPGQPDVKFRHYAGYIRLREQDERALFYWFFEAQGGVSEKPLLLWLNGGPGCSSIAYGALQELGPFLVRNNHSKLVLNDYAWNKVANLLFLESPVGVGFSYTNRSSDLSKLGDRVTAQDSYAFLLKWFEKYPSFKSHDFYIAGESYAGHYVPQLAEVIYDRNVHAPKGSYINFKGIMIGNAVLNDETDQEGMVDFAWSHAVISDQLYRRVKRQCDFSSENQTTGCNNALSTMLQAYGDIDIYSIYSPVCTATLTKSSLHSSPRLVASPRAFSKHELWHRLPSGVDPCTEEYTTDYLRRKDVQEALHANITNLKYPYKPCSEVIAKWNDAPDSVLPVLRKLMKGGLRVWVFSGDTDGRVPVTSTRYSLNKMQLKEKAAWRAWFHNHQVAGWTVEYEGLTFATLRGAGHQAPVYVPQQALSLLTHFLSASTLPSSRF